MTPEQVNIVRLTFAQAMDRKLEVGKMFYERLFAIAPDTRAMFGSDIEAQSRKLMDTLALAIGSLRDTPALVGMLERLAERHISYGVRDEHYTKVGEALLWTLQKAFGDAFTPRGARRLGHSLRHRCGHHAAGSARRRASAFVAGFGIGFKSKVAR